MSAMHGSFYERVLKFVRVVLGRVMKVRRCRIARVEAVSKRQKNTLIHIHTQTYAHIHTPAHPYTHTHTHKVKD